MKHTLFLSIIILLSASCEKSSLNTAASSLNRLVVESYLQPGKYAVVQIKKQIPYNAADSIQYPVAGLLLSIEEVETGNIYPLVQSDSTAYIGDTTWQPVAGYTYRLSFEYDGKTITAETIVPDKPATFVASASSIEGFSPGGFTPGSGTPPSFPDPIELTWDASDGGYYLIVVESAESNPELIFSDTTNFRPFRSFRSEPQQTNTWNIQSMSFRYYGVHNIILYRLNAEYAALYESNGTNSTNLTTPFTNVDGGLGVFTGVNADTLQITVTE